MNILRLHVPSSILKMIKKMKKKTLFPLSSWCCHVIPFASLTSCRMCKNFHIKNNKNMSEYAWRCCWNFSHLWWCKFMIFIHCTMVHNINNIMKNEFLGYLLVGCFVLLYIPSSSLSILCLLFKQVSTEIFMFTCVAGRKKKSIEKNFL